LELGQVALVIAILILLFILLKLFRVNRKDWILFVSSGVFALALKMTLERLPFNINFFDFGSHSALRSRYFCLPKVLAKK
jgi:hypothetical protein